MGAVGIGGVVLHSSFLGKELKLKPIPLSIRLKKQSNSRIIYGSFAHDLFVGVGVGLSCTVMECGDIIYRSTLPKSNGITVTVPGVILALGTLSYLWATPGVAPGFFDMFVVAFVERLFRPTDNKDDIVLGKKLGEGSFGSVYRVSLARKPSSKSADLVLKRATEYGAVEIWMNKRVRRACANSYADFLYGFLESSSKKGAEYWLLRRFEGEATLADLMQSREFPYNHLRHCSRSAFGNAGRRHQIQVQRNCDFRVKALPDWPLMAMLVEHIEGQRDLITHKSVWHLSDEAMKSVYTFYIMFTVWGCCFFGSTKDPYYDSEQYRGDGGDGTGHWVYEKQEDIEETARAELWREELIEEIEQKVGGLRELEEAVKKEQLVK